MALFMMINDNALPCKNNIVFRNFNLLHVLSLSLKVLGKGVGGENAKVLSYEVTWYKICQK